MNQALVEKEAADGAGIISIEGTSVKIGNKQMDVGKFCDLIAQNTLSGIQDQPIPDNVKWVVRSGLAEAYIVELKPELRNIQWLADNSPAGHGDKATYTPRRLATPYVVASVPIWRGNRVGNIRLFYRNAPLESLDDPLYYTNLYNVAHEYSGDGWFCKTYLDLTVASTADDILSEVINHIWGGGFNKSVLHASEFDYYQMCGSDKRLKDVHRWEEESIKDPKFVLGVDWIKAKATPRSLINQALCESCAAAPGSAKVLGNIILASG